MDYQWPIRARRIGVHPSIFREYKLSVKSYPFESQRMKVAHIAGKGCGPALCGTIPGDSSCGWLEVSSPLGFFGAGYLRKWYGARIDRLCPKCEKLAKANRGMQGCESQ